MKIRKAVDKMRRRGQELLKFLVQNIKAVYIANDQFLVLRC